MGTGKGDPRTYTAIRKRVARYAMGQRQMELDEEVEGEEEETIA